MARSVAAAAIGSTWGEPSTFLQPERFAGILQSLRLWIRFLRKRRRGGLATRLLLLALGHSARLQARTALQDAALLARTGSTPSQLCAAAHLTCKVRTLPAKRPKRYVMRYWSCGLASVLVGGVPLVVRARRLSVMAPQSFYVW